MSDFEFYKHFQFKQLIEDAEFRKWVLSPTKEREAFWNAFLVNFPDKNLAIKEARAFLLGNKDYFEKTDLSEQIIQERLQAVLDKVSTNVANSQPATTRKFSISYRWFIAASIALMLGLFSWFWLSSSDNSLIYTTNFGEWKTIELPDGSTVKLNADSELRLAKKWKEGACREVWLEGEAFFKIVKNERNPEFRVITSDLGVEVLGTSFNVKARDESTEVYLEEGKVKLKHGEKETFLVPGDVIAYSARKNKIIERHKADLTPKVPGAWKEGVILMTNEYPLQILNKLEEIYGVEILIKNDLIYEKKYTVALPMKELKTVIPILEKAMKVKITQQKDLIIIE